ncbi:MAG: bifunctional phosphopantothenoylcysteine decarboxylase/phosphopantothenate--cysteine ligase CoaBC [Syntrophales bacterium]|jgi:phosphopantothenoylcysteine decarboxylase/phosphopantothenate--cysteine ligase|nr:bifunctional phosphopantothenoylcysteine decarboxylase/phosphopantothenate--cysteine ligase CoaBC [Syntrophales bacterium]
MLKERKIALCVTGGIAAYKAAELLREFVRRGADVRVVMTESACKLVAPLTFETLSGHPVATDLFSLNAQAEIPHIALAAFADLLVVAPATANIIGKAAAGIADDLVSTIILATTKPVLFCPAMNVNMYENAIVQKNLAELAARGYLIMAPGYGELACRTEGRGRLPEPVAIAEEVEYLLAEKDLRKERIIVTAGPTQEPLDPVRFISNYSSGKMGYALAVAARRRGAKVTLISGPVALSPPAGVDFVPVKTALQMHDAVLAALPAATVVIKAAAVADYRPAVCAESKIKKKEGPMTLLLERNPDIIAEIARQKGNRIVVGFSMESDHLLEHARKKLFDKGMDFIVANDVTEAGAGFGGDTNIVRILDREGGMEELPLLSKLEVAGVILDRVKKMREQLPLAG